MIELEEQDQFQRYASVCVLPFGVYADVKPYELSQENEKIDCGVFDIHLPNQIEHI